MDIDQLRERLRKLTGKPLSLASELPPPPPRPAPPPPLGDEVSTAEGPALRRTVLYENRLSHGRVQVSSVSWLDRTCLATLGHELGDLAAGDLAFLDTETSGISGGAGTFAFLVGIGEIVPEGFLVTQYLMRDLPEEPAVLALASRHLAGRKALVTYNGKAFDWPLLAARFRLHGIEPPTVPLHLDLLFLARRLWRPSLGSARLVALEEGILGFQRNEDLASFLIPEAYFCYVSDGRADLMEQVLSHNAMDILSLAVLTAAAGRLLAGHQIADLPLDHLALARVAEHRRDRALACQHYRRAVEIGLEPGLARELLTRLARISKKNQDPRGACWALERLLEQTGGMAIGAYEELSRLAERELGDLEAARDWCAAGLRVMSGGLASLGGRLGAIAQRLRRRLARLERRLARSRTKAP